MESVDLESKSIREDFESGKPLVCDELWEVVEYADRACDSLPHRDELRNRGIEPYLAQRNSEHGSGLGVDRWVSERTSSWLHQFRRLRVRFDRRDDLHPNFTKLTESLTCFRSLSEGICQALEIFSL
jgi:hypothetical protein